MKALRILFAALSIACLVPLAQAGQTCVEHTPDAMQVYRALELAKKSYDWLDQSGAEVAIIARAGQDLSRYGLSYSHLGIVRRDNPEGRWTVTHLLNQCGTSSADLYNQGLGDFFMDDMYQYRTLIMIPSPAIRARMVQLLSSGHARDFFSDHYNMLAYPFSTDYENSNQWVLELMAAALANDTDIPGRESAQAWLRATHYIPSTIHLSAFERLGAEVTRANVSFSDHPFDRRMAGEIDTVTVDSMERFFRARDPGLQEAHLVLEIARVPRL